MTKDEAIKYLQQIYPNGGHCWLDEQRIEAIGMAIKALQEEPKVKFKVGDVILMVNDDCGIGFQTIKKICCDGYLTAEMLKIKFEEQGQWELAEEPVSIDFEQELYKAFGQVKDFTLGMRIAKWFYDMGKQHQEPVSEDLEEASKEWLRPQLDKSYANYGEAMMMELTHFDGYAMLDAIEFGAKWQETKDESTTEDLGEYINELSKQFPEVSFAKLSRIAVRVAKWQMAQMIKDATDVTVHVDAGGYPYIPQIELYDYDKDVPLAKEGDKYKVVLIKEG